MAHQEVPVECRERTGAFAFAQRRVVAAAGAVSGTHALDVFAGRHIRLAGHQPTIGVLAHAQRVGQLDPLDRIDIDREVPRMHLARLDAEHQRVQPRHHQALDVVRVAVAQGLLQRIAQAGHIGLAGPVPGGQWLVCVERVEFDVGWHLRPVDAAHVLTPTEDLADEALHALQRRPARVVRGLGGLHHFARVQQLEVERRRQQRVVEPGLAWPHRILVAPEVRQAVRDEGFERLQRLLARHRPGEIIEPSRVHREARVDQIDDLSRHSVGLEASRRRHVTWPRRAEGLAVVGIEVPLPADRLAVLHQHAVALAQLAVEVFETERLAALGVRRELAHRAEEVPIVAYLQRQPGTLGDGPKRLQHAPVTRCAHHQPLRMQALDRAQQFIGERGAAGGVVEPRVVQRPTGTAKRLRKVPHGGQEHRDARLARPHLRRLFGDLGHPDGVMRRIEAIECGRFQIELIAQHDDERA